MPHPDLKCRDSAVAGVCKRFGRKPPEPDHAKIKRFGSFVESWLKNNLTPLSPETDVSFDTWIEKTPYSLARKNQLRETFKDLGNIHDPAYAACKSFIKDEFYADYKYPRGINSRTDSMKVVLGPWFKVIEEVLFKMHYFIKKIPVADRPNYIKEKLARNGSIYLASDYTSFEALFTSELMHACEFKLYKYMTQFIPNHDEFWRLLDEVLGGTNLCKYKNFDVEIDATRMSGEMCTSLGNGFSNLMFILFICFELGSEVDGVVEGDDGLFAIKGPVPTESDFESLGLRVKLEVHEELSEASFCGLIFDDNDLINVTDPIAELATFGWGTSRYACAKRTKLLSLLRCKGLSLIHQYPGCPIIQELGLYSLRVTRGIDVRTYIESTHVSLWEKEQLLAALRDERKLMDKVRPPPFRTRLLMEKKYGVTVDQQRRIEDMLRSKHSLDAIRLPFDVEIPTSWMHYDSNYVHQCDPTELNKFNFDPPIDIAISSAWHSLFPIRGT